MSYKISENYYNIRRSKKGVGEEMERRDIHKTQKQLEVTRVTRLVTLVILVLRLEPERPSTMELGLVHKTRASFMTRSSL